MPDVVDPATRSRMMAGIRGSNTKPERIIRSALHRRGLRFRLNGRQVAGRPDLVLPRHKVAVFVHGCFWHGHDCPLFRLPSTRATFWEEKISRNRIRDATVRTAVIESGWRHLAIWECAIRGRGACTAEAVAEDVCTWIEGGARTGDIRGHRPNAH